jgi:hypothetical protein
MEDANVFWEQVFGDSPAVGTPRSWPMRQVRKGGQPWLLLPARTRLAARVLDLYPAQTLRARVARAGLRCALAAGVPWGTGRVALRVSTEAPFAQFLAGLGAELPRLGVLAGNAATPGQRFILVVFDAKNQPVAVVKAGLTERARELVQRELTFLGIVRERTPGIPALRATFESPSRCAFALDFFPGRSPAADDPGGVSRLLTDWIDQREKMLVPNSRAWNELSAACAEHPVYHALTKKLANRVVRAAIVHGDFAPWNIKARDWGDWMVLDWERGSFGGLPGWDWFHYVIQPSLLVARDTTSASVERLERLLALPLFQFYARAGGIAGVERELALTYLLHHNEVIQPSEGLERGRALLAALAARWLKA